MEVSESISWKRRRGQGGWLGSVFVVLSLFLAVWSAQLSKAIAATTEEVNSGNQTRCADGYTGPLCTICAAGYGKSVWNNTCHSCGGSDFSSSTVALTIVVITVAGIVLLLAGLVALFARECKEGEDSGDMSLFKIMLSWIQVMSTLGRTFRVPWPEAFLHQMNAFYSLANLEVFGIFGNFLCGMKMTAVLQLYLHLATLPVVLAIIASALDVAKTVVETTDAQCRRMRCAITHICILSHHL